MSSQFNSSGLYRSRRNGIIFGVCRGIAEWRDLSVVWIRLAAILLTLLTGVWPAIVAYVVAAVLMKPEPAIPFNNDLEREFYNSYSHSRALAVSRLKKAADTLERRTRRLESIVLDREADWERRFRQKAG